MAQILGRYFGESDGWDESGPDVGDLSFYNVFLADEARGFLNTDMRYVSCLNVSLNRGTFSWFDEVGDEEIMFKPNWHYFANWKETA